MQKRGATMAEVDEQDRVDVGPKIGTSGGTRLLKGKAIPWTRCSQGLRGLMRGVALRRGKLVKVAGEP